jgi:hypothetical protein
MKRCLVFASGLFLALGLAAQDIRHVSRVVNIEIPVRVFKGDVFIEDLNLDDFEVFEDGVPQKIEAVYLVKKTHVERSQERSKFNPATGRHFYLFFELSDYDPRIGGALEHLVRNVLIPGDNLAIVTPMKTYRMKSETFEILGPDRVISQLVGLIRRDAMVGNSLYRDTLKELTGLSRAMASAISLAVQDPANPTGRIVDSIATSSPIDPSVTVDEVLQRYADVLERINRMRSVDQKKLLEFASHLRELDGQKAVFLFYQREYIPKIDPKILNTYSSLYMDRPDILQTVAGLFDFFRRESSLDVDFVKKAFAAASTSVHFLFYTRPMESVPGVIMEEQSEDIYAPFIEMAQATGGYYDASSNPLMLMRNALTASENYYLLYYTPKELTVDSRFRSVEVKVRSGGYRVSHRAGYIAD